MATIRKKDTNTSNNSRVIIIVCVIILILIPVVIWLLGHRSIARPPSSTPKSEFTTYQSNGNTLQYPKGWSESESGVPEGAGEVYYLQPPNADPTVNPHVIIKVTTATKVEVARTDLSYKLLNYQKEDATVDGMSAQEYTHVLQSVHGPFHSIAYVFQKKGNIYLIELGYTQSNKDPQLENEFTQIVNNFSTD